MSEHSKDLEERLFQFSIKLLKYLRTVNNSSEDKVIKYQLIKSGTSAGANYSPCQIESYVYSVCFT